MHPIPVSRILPFVIVASAAFAQESAEFIPVEAGVADVSVLSTSLQVPQVGLDPGTGFDRVYRVPGESGRHFRASGALFAVFDQSVYLSWNGAEFPAVPPSTTFYIGAPPFLAPAPDAFVPGPGDSRIRPREADGPGYGLVPVTSATSGDSSTVDRRVDQAGVLPRFVTAVGYRARRLGEIRSHRESPRRDRDRD